MRLGQDVLRDPSRAFATEWLLANGLGGSASGTAAGVHTRRSHALLVSTGPHGRLFTALLAFDERLHAADGPVDLAPRLVATGAPRPPGGRWLEEFRLDPWPTWRYRVGETVLEKTLFMLNGHNAVAVSWRQLAGPEARLTVSPQIVARAPDQLQHERADLRGAAQGVPGRVRIETIAGQPPLTLWHNGSFMPARVWHHGLAYPADGSTGSESSEDAFVPGHVEATLAPGMAFHVVAATEDDLFRALAIESRLGTPPPRTLTECVELLDRGERERERSWRRAALEGADFTARQAAAAHGGGLAGTPRLERLVPEGVPWTAPLADALFQGLARRGHRLTLVSALPGAEEHGAATLRALPALVALRAFEPVASILRGYAEYLDEGLAPERFDRDDGTPRYGDAEPSLWLVHASELLARRGEDLAFVKEGLYPALESVMQSYRAGTRGGIQVGADGLLATGAERPVRRADLNVLWYHALVAMAQLARLAGRKESGAFYLAWAHQHQKCFNEKFWDEEHGCLYEVLGPAGPEPGLTPPQLLAVSLAPPILPAARAGRLVATAARDLLTPFGLREHAGARSASPAWLGPFFTAWLRVHQRSPAAQSQVRAWFDALAGQIGSGAAGHLPESSPVEGQAAARPPGPVEPASILAAAELLRVWIEEVDRVEEPAGALSAGC